MKLKSTTIVEPTFWSSPTVRIPAVQYDYDNGIANTIRPLSMIYPDGRQIDYVYGNPSSQTDLLDRVETIEDGSTTLVTYQHAGSGSVVTQTYNQPGIAKTLNLGSGTDPYAALDRFGRMEDLRWSKGTSKKVHFEYGYDRNSNRLFERNRKSNVHSHLLGYDELNRLTSSKTGSLNGSNVAILSPTLDQSFTLDETGNFAGFDQSGSSVATLNQTRVHDTVNEITDITETVGLAWATPGYDANGNMTVIPQPNDLTEGYTATWDAWNRLVQVDDEGSLETVASYEYDGNNRRIVVDAYDSGSPSQTRHVYYSLQSQALEERVDSLADAETQFVWNLGYVDGLILRDRDTTGNSTLNQRLYALSDLRYSIVALASTNGTIVERFDYNAYGQATVMNGSFVNRTTGSSYNWQFRYTGRRQDLDTGLMYFRARYYDPQTGEFISRDPLGYVDGMSLYRGYFVPGAVDPSGQWTIDGVLKILCCSTGESRWAMNQIAIQGLNIYSIPELKRENEFEVTDRTGKRRRETRPQNALGLSVGKDIYILSSDSDIDAAATLLEEVYHSVYADSDRTADMAQQPCRYPQMLVELFWSCGLSVLSFAEIVANGRKIDPISI